jgi:tetratricopeptide (TPR) repeat protein
VARPDVSGRLFGTTPVAATLYLEAGEVMRTRDHLRAAELLRRALAADSSFAMAWRRLEAALGNGGLSEQERFIALENATRWRDRLPSQSGRAYAEISDLRARGEYDAALERAKVALREFPKNPNIINVIGNLYSEQRKPDLALRMYAELFRTAIEERQSSPLVANYLNALLDNTRFAEMRSEIARSSSVFGAHNATVYTGRFRLAGSMLQIDSILAVGREQLAHFKTDREKLEGYAAVAHGMRLAGRLDSASVFERRRREIVLGAQQTRIAVVSVAQEAMLRAMVIGDARGAQILLDSALKVLRWDTLPVLDRAYDRVIMAKVAAGDLATARQMLSAWQRDVPIARAKPQSWIIAGAKGEIALADGDGRSALNEFRIADVSPCRACSFMRFARAFDKLQQPDSVIFWYERALASNVGRLADRVDEIPRAYRRLGELYEAKGDTKRAIQRYSDFVELWKNADPALQPLVKDVRERIARLQKKTG